MTSIISFSVIVWIFLDRFKKLWQGNKYSSLITSFVALLLGLAIAFIYGLDLVTELGLSDTPNIMGYIFTGLAIMGGSSCINEILQKIANPFDTDITEGE